MEITALIYREYFVKKKNILIQRKLQSLIKVLFFYSSWERVEDESCQESFLFSFFVRRILQVLFNLLRNVVVHYWLKVNTLEKLD